MSDLAMTQARLEYACGVGKLVVLKSGGERMTVSRGPFTNADGLRTVEVVWFSGTEMKREELPLETLMPETRVDW